jgi:predicted transcriptional regulator
VCFIKQRLDRLAHGIYGRGESGLIRTSLREIAEQAEDGNQAVIAAWLRQHGFACEAAGKIVKGAENVCR